MPPIDVNLRKWWPTTQSLDLIQAPIEMVAEAVQQEFARFANGDPVTRTLRRFESVGDVLAAETDFYNVPTKIVVLPTRSKWSVLWNNSFLCDGYDALCWCLTSHHHLTTIHWSAHDDWTTFQSGATFHLRRHDGANVVERRVNTAQTDKKWDFFESGEPLPEEDVAGYKAKRKRDRLNERRIMDLLSRLDAEPWKESFYAIPGNVIAISRLAGPNMVGRTRDEVLLPAG